MPAPGSSNFPGRPGLFFRLRNERCPERAGSGVFEAGRRFNPGGQFLRGRERIHLAAAARQPAVQPVADDAGVGLADVERPLRFEDAPNLVERGREVFEMLQAVIRNNQIEATIAERKTGGAGLSEIGNRAVGRIETDPDDCEGTAFGAKTARGAAQVLNHGARRQSLQQFVHV